MAPSNFSHIFMFTEVLFLSGTLYRFSNFHRRTQINRTELGQAQLGLAEKQLELAREQMELAQNQISTTSPIKTQKTQMELAQAQMTLAQAQTEIAQQQMPLRESPPIQSSEKRFPWNMLGERYNVQPGSHRNHDPKVCLEHERVFHFPKGDFRGGSCPGSHRNHDPKVCLEHERVFQFPKGDFSDGSSFSLLSSSFTAEVVISAPEV